MNDCGRGRSFERSAVLNLTGKRSGIFEGLLLGCWRGWKLIAVVGRVRNIRVREFQMVSYLTVKMTHVQAEEPIAY